MAPASQRAGETAVAGVIARLPFPYLACLRACPRSAFAAHISRGYLGPLDGGRGPDRGRPRDYGGRHSQFLSRGYASALQPACQQAYTAGAAIRPTLACFYSMPASA